MPRGIQVSCTKSWRVPWKSIFPFLSSAEQGCINKNGRPLLEYRLFIHGQSSRPPLAPFLEVYVMAQKCPYEGPPTFWFLKGKAVWLDKHAYWISPGLFPLTIIFFWTFKKTLSEIMLETAAEAGKMLGFIEAHASWMFSSISPKMLGRKGDPRAPLHQWGKISMGHQTSTRSWGMAGKRFFHLAAGVELKLCEETAIVDQCSLPPTCFQKNAASQLSFSRHG